MRDLVKVKICGLNDPADTPAAIAAGADYLGFNFFPKTPRCVGLDTAAHMAAAVPEELIRVGLVVDANDATLDAITGVVPLDMIQLHGAETPARVAEVKARTGKKVMKVLGVATAEDLRAIDAYADVADQLLIDAKPPPGADRPGGNAVSFDWTLIAGRDWTLPWMLAGGLTPRNVAEAIRLTGARQVDVASGVESATAVKDAGLMQAFIAAARAA